MAKTVTISPVTRIEGHAKISVFLDDVGNVADARFHVTEFRGFEKFCLGRSYREMPSITERICGICPVSHALASAKAGDMLKGVAIPPAAEKLRRLMHCAQFVQSHALSFYLLSGPDLLLGMESDPAKRNLVGLIEKMPETAREGIRLRQYGQEIIRLMGDRSVHPAWVVSGGVREPLTLEKRDMIARGLPEALETVKKAIVIWHDTMEQMQEESRFYGNFPGRFMALVSAEGTIEHYDGRLRIIDADGTVALDQFDPSGYQDLVEEFDEGWSYLKSPRLKPGRFEGDDLSYRVGPLARLNAADWAGTPLADAELKRFRQIGENGRVVLGSFYYHYARLIEILFCLESIEKLLGDPELTDRHVRSHARTNNRIGIGVVEAPRGLLFHEYHVDDNGLLTKVNLLVATGHNNQAMNRTIKQIAARYIKGGVASEGVLNRIEHGIRCYDPCLSCSTHAVGSMPLRLELIAPSGDIVGLVIRGGS